MPADNRHSARKRLAVAVAAVLLATAPTFVIAADDPWAAARDAIAQLNWNNAIRQYASLRDQSQQGSAKWVEATFCEAVAQQNGQPASADGIGQASKLYQEIVDNGKEDRFVARSLMNLGRIAELKDYPDDTVDLAGAIKNYEQVMQRWPDQPIGSEAALRSAAARVMEYDAPSFTKVNAGIAVLKDWLKGHPNNPYANVMWQYLGDTYFNPLKDYPKALQAYNEVEKIGWPDDGNQGAWYWRCAQLADRYLNDPKTAIHYYTQVIVKAPAGGKGYAAMQALKRLGGPLPDVTNLLDDSTKAPSP